MFFGALEAVPWFENHFPDLLYTLHQLQLAICCALGFMFVVIISYARGAQDFIDDNWDSCYYQNVCEAVGKDNWSMQEYAASLNVDRTGLEGMLRPMLYAASVSCLSSLCMLAGGSNLAKYSKLACRLTESLVVLATVSLTACRFLMSCDSVLPNNPEPAGGVGSSESKRQSRWCEARCVSAEGSRATTGRYQVGSSGDETIEDNRAGGDSLGHGVCDRRLDGAALRVRRAKSRPVHFIAPRRACRAAGCHGRILSIAQMCCVRLFLWLL